MQFFQKSIEHCRPQRVADLYGIATAVVDGSTAATREVCDVLRLGGSAFYAWLSAVSTISADSDSPLTPVVNLISRQH